MAFVQGPEKRRFFPPPFIHIPTPTDDAHTVCDMRHFSASFGGVCSHNSAAVMSNVCTPSVVISITSSASPFCLASLCPYTPRFVSLTCRESKNRGSILREAFPLFSKQGGCIVRFALFVTRHQGQIALRPRLRKSFPVIFLPFPKTDRIE